MKNESTAKTSLDLFVNVLYILMYAIDILQNVVDKELKKNGECFRKDKKQYFSRFMQKMSEAWYWYEKLGTHDSVWEAAHGEVKRYDSFHADANELLREICLYVDRSHSREGFEKIFQFLRALPEQGLFSVEDISRFDFKRPWVARSGDRVRTEIFGDGTLELQTNGDNWIINMDDGSQRVLSEKQFKQI